MNVLNFGSRGKKLFTAYMMIPPIISRTTSQISVANMMFELVIVNNYVAIGSAGIGSTTGSATAVVVSVVVVVLSAVVIGGFSGLAVEL